MVKRTTGRKTKPSSWIPWANKGNGKKSRPARVQPIAGTTIVETAACTKNFAYAQRNPFEAFEDKTSEVCMPDAIVLPTSKRRVMSKGNGACGTTGVGYIVGRPRCITNNGGCCEFTTSSSVGTTATTPASFTFTGVGQFANSEFSNVDLAAGILEYRTAACGIRIRYTGTRLNEGGTVYAWRSPSNSDVTGTALDAWINSPTCKKFPFSREWVTLRWKLATPDDVDFSTTASSVDSMIIAIVSGTGATQPFEWEMVNFHEVVGRSVSSLTESHSDPVGFGAVQAVGARGSDSYKGRGPSKNSIVASVGNVIKESTSYIKEYGPSIMNAGSTLASMYQLAGSAAPSMAQIAQEVGPYALMAAEAI